MVVFGLFLPAPEGPVARVRVDPYVVAVLHAQLLGIQRVYVYVAFGHEGLSLIVAVDVAEGPEEDGHHVGVDGHGVGSVAVLGRVEDETVAVFGQGVG